MNLTATAVTAAATACCSSLAWSQHTLQTWAAFVLNVHGLTGASNNHSYSRNQLTLCGSTRITARITEPASQAMVPFDKSHTPGLVLCAASVCVVVQVCVVLPELVYDEAIGSVHLRGVGAAAHSGWATPSLVE
jgi:hypothetical protein